MELNRFRGIEELISTSDFIYSDKFFQHTLVCERCDYSKRDFLYRFGFWRGLKIRPKSLQSRVPSKSSLLIGHSDKETAVGDLVPFLLKGYVNFWATNARPFGSTLNSLPLGLTNPSAESQMHRVLGDTSHFETADRESTFPVSFDGSIYGNFSVETNSRVRKPLVEFLEKNGTPFKEPLFSGRGRIDYLKSLRQHSLTVCPEGNGVDTHRIWETLYMGGTPVITKSPFMTNLIEGLPVLVLDDWSELQDLRKLEDKWNSLNFSNFNFRKLYASYWVEKFCI